MADVAAPLGVLCGLCNFDRRAPRDGPGTQVGRALRLMAESMALMPEGRPQWSPPAEGMRCGGMLIRDVRWHLGIACFLSEADIGSGI